MTSSLIAQNRADIEVALRDYVAHTNTNNEGLFAYRISGEFLDRLATDSTLAKSGLRDMFRKVDGWNEELQAVILNATLTNEPNGTKVFQLASDILYEPRMKCLGTDEFKRNMFCKAEQYFMPGNEKDTDHIDALKYFIGRKYRADKKKSKLFQDLAKAVGVYDDTAGSTYQKLFAQLAAELNGQAEDLTVFLSINPAHILTASNPLGDKRGQCLVSCHSLNRDDYSYGSGNIGYARDDVTFVAFTVDKPNKPELLNNRKTRRQFYMYKPQNGLLLQSRLYDSHGGTFGDKPAAKLFRRLVQKTIATAEGFDNLWSEEDYCDSDFNFNTAKGFGGYPDWNEYRGESIKISVREGFQERAKEFKIGAPSLCVACGTDIYTRNGDEGQWVCNDCDDEHEICEECGRRINTDCGQWVFDFYGDEVFVCESCLFNGDYHFCEDCERWHHSDNCTRVTIGSIKRWVCNDCLEEGYVECQCCGDWIPKEKSFDLKKRGDYITVCECCFDDYGVDCQCCGDRCHPKDVDKNGYCSECVAEGYSPDDEHTA